MLSGSVKEILLGKGVAGTVIGTLNRKVDDRTSVRAALAKLSVAGVPVSDVAPVVDESGPGPTA